MGACQGVCFGLWFGYPECFFLSTIIDIPTPIIRVKQFTPSSIEYIEYIVTVLGERKRNGGNIQDYQIS